MWRAALARAPASIWNSRWSGRLCMSRAMALPVNPLSSGRASQAGTILIVDDEAAIRESLQTLLEMEGYRVVFAEDGEDGLARIAADPFDLVLLDYALPGRNG